MSLFDLMRKTQEAYCVRHGIPVERQFSDAELAPCAEGIAQAERELYGLMSDEERIGRLGPEEQALLDELNGTSLIPFRTTVTVPGRLPEQIDVLAPNACAAVTMVLELLFPDFDSVKPHGGLKVAVEPVRRAA